MYFEPRTCKEIYIYLLLALNFTCRFWLLVAGTLHQVLGGYTVTCSTYMWSQWRVNTITLPPLLGASTSTSKSPYCASHSDLPQIFIITDYYSLKAAGCYCMIAKRSLWILPNRCRRLHKSPIKYHLNWQWFSSYYYYFFFCDPALARDRLHYPLGLGIW